MAVMEFRIAWNKGSERVLKPTSILVCGTRIRKATAAGIAMETKMIALVKLRCATDPAIVISCATSHPPLS